MADSLNSLAMNERLGIVILSVLSIALTCSVSVTADNDTNLPTAKPFWLLYKDGVEAYLDQDWTGCIANLENALSEWKFYRKATVQCRLGCASEAKKKKSLMDDDIEDLHFSEEMVRRTLCLMRCSDAHWGKRTLFVERKVEEAFLTLKPYEYLQVCYYQDQDLYKAASSAYTVLALRPDDEIMKGNLKFYLDQSEIMDFSSLVNYEQQSFVAVYFDGVTAYQEQDYLSAVVNLEKSLTEYIQAEEECRAYCEGAFDQGWFPDLHSSYANHFTFCLKCKRRCPDTLSVINGQYRPDFLPNHYNYLQFAYYKLGRMYEAYGAAASYLQFYPDDDTMLQNKRFYETGPSYMKDLFRPREEAVKYLKRQEYETKLLNFIEKEFVFDRKSAQQNRKDEDDIELSIVEKNLPKEPKMPAVCLGFKNATNPQSLLKSCKSERKPRVEARNGIKMTHWTRHGFRTEEELGGKLRFSADGFADPQECQILLDLSLNRGVAGDGYEGNESPHSEMEHFEGISLWRLAEASIISTARVHSYCVQKRPHHVFDMGTRGLERWNKHRFFRVPALALKSPRPHIKYMPWTHMVRLNEVDASVMELFMELSERGKNTTELYFGQPGKFHFAFSQIACRTGIPEKTKATGWMSHKIHADNCQLQASGECLKEEPAYTSNDYSSIIYLNDNFEGGEFIFSEDPFGKVIQSTITPKCGRMIGFTAGPENKHGVRGVTKGTRCALGLWFTKDPAFTERRPSLMETIQQIRSRSKQKNIEEISDTTIIN